MPPTIDDVIASATDTLQKAYSVKGAPSPMDQLVTAQAQAVSLQSSLDAMTTDDNAQKAKLATAKAEAQDLVTKLS